jgi:hypothetical protein
MVRFAPFVFPLVSWKTFVSPNYYTRPHVLRGNPKRITSRMEGITSKNAATTYIKGLSRL